MAGELKKSLIKEDRQHRTTYDIETFSFLNLPEQPISKYASALSVTITVIITM
jgi:hypothetical protein